MKGLYTLFDFKHITGGKQAWLYLYMLVYLVYAFTTGLEDQLLAVSILIFAVAPLQPTFLMFVFYLLWEDVTVFSFGTTVISINVVLLVLKIILQRKRAASNGCMFQNKTLKLRLLLLSYFIIMGFFSFVLFHNLTSINFILKIFITFYIIPYLYDDHIASNLFQSIIQVLMYSSLIATIYGFFHDTGVERWLAEIGDTVTQFYGTMGTTRMAFFYLIGIIYFLYYIDDKIVKFVGLILFTILTFMTISLTAVILYIFVVLIYMYSFGKLKKGLSYTIAIVALVLILFPVWSSFSYVKPVIYRVTYSIDAFEQGNINVAVSGREELRDIYMAELKKSDLSNLIFGNARTAMSVTGIEMNSHNTYIDILFYFGITGLILFGLYQLRIIKLIKRKSYFYPILTLKIIFILGSATVSIMSATYFMFLIFI